MLKPSLPRIVFLFAPAALILFGIALTSNNALAQLLGITMAAIAWPLFIACVPEEESEDPEAPSAIPPHDLQTGSTSGASRIRGGQGPGYL